MSVIKKSIDLGKTIRNVSRLREILSVFAKHGFDEIIIRSKLNKVIPNFVLPKSVTGDLNNALNDYDFWRSVGRRLKLAFEELGPSFIKVGQLLASREDIFNPAFIAELKQLQDKVKPIPFSDALEIIEFSLGKKANEVFKEINETPIGVASIGIVYKAVMLNGDQVVLKVRRPNIKKNLLTDFEIIDYIVGSVERVVPEFKFLGVQRVIEDFFKSIKLELNFLVEANNSLKLKKNIEKIDVEKILIIPKVYREISSEKLLVMEYLDGVPFNELKPSDKNPVLEENLHKCVKYFLHTMLADGFFHADLHGGNFFQLKDDKVGLIDFGLVGNLSKRNRTSLVAILYALLTNNFENLVYEFLDVADYEELPNHDHLIRDLRENLTPYIGLSVQEMDATALTHSLVSTLSRHHVYLPREWFIILRALMTLDGVGKSLKVDLNIFEIIDNEIHGILGELVSKDALIEDSVWLARDVMNSLRIVPRHISWVLKEFAKKNYRVDIELKGIDHEINLLTRSIYFFAMMLIASAFFLAGTLMVQGITVTSVQDLPILTVLFWGLCAAVLTRAFFIFKLR